MLTNLYCTFDRETTSSRFYSARLRAFSLGLLVNLCCFRILDGAGVRAVIYTVGCYLLVTFLRLRNLIATSQSTALAKPSTSSSRDMYTTLIPGTLS